MPHDHDDALHNPARFDDAPPSREEADLSSDEYMVFAMRDSHHAFSLGLETVLECIRAAELEGAVPTLHAEWWWELQKRYALDFTHAPLD
ncbi:hypothetical protein [Carnimonas bestiolae]|uniref:hypothetical protein n=1 Tax=Carnimonas bestiolae TaxID=3402172 RepID=UPI003EDBCCA2